MGIETREMMIKTFPIMRRLRLWSLKSTLKGIKSYYVLQGNAINNK